MIQKGCTAALFVTVESLCVGLAGLFLIIPKGNTFTLNS